MLFLLHLRFKRDNKRKKTTFMKKKFRMHYILWIALIFVSACKKQNVIEAPTENPAIVIPPTTPDPKPADPIPPLFSYEVGLGSGNLVIDGTTFTINGPSIIKIKSGTYSTITVKNFIQNDATPVYIKNSGLVEFTSGQSTFSNLRNVTFSGDGTPGIDKGFVFRDISYRAIKLDENSSINKFTFQHVSFKNIGNLVIAFLREKPYDGTPDSYSEDLKFLHIDCDNTSSLLACGGYIDGDNANSVVGVIKNLEVGYVNFKNSPGVGNVVYAQNAENYDIHHNIVNNINTGYTTGHPGIFMMGGHGKFHHNQISNHYGNAIRAWGHAIGSTPKDILIYNNIVYNSRKYSGFEVQAFDYTIIPGKSTYTNAKVFNNTVGNINLSKDWQGNVIDVYSLNGGKCDVFNNLAFNLYSSGTDQVYIAGQQSNLKATEANNIYFKTSKDAGILDESSFKLSGSSSAKGKGRYEVLLKDDYYGATRANSPSIGAVE